MSKEFSAQYMTTFLEHDLELSCDLVARKFGENASLHERKFLDSNIRIVDGKYLEVNRPGNTECLDLCNIDHIFGYKWARKRTEFPQLLVFRFLARLITEGAAPNEVHVFGLDTLSQMEAALHLLSEAVENAKRSQKPPNTQGPITRSMSMKMDSTNRQLRSMMPDRAKRRRLD